MEWDAAFMPWDECRVVVARLARPIGECGLAALALPLTTRVLARPHVAYASPQFSPDSRHLAYTSDESGWRSLWVTPLEGWRPARKRAAYRHRRGRNWRAGLGAGRDQDALGAGR